MRAFFRQRGGSIANYVGFVVFAFVVLFPFYWIVMSSFTPRFELFQVPPRYWPANPTLENYPNMIESIPFWEYYANSLIFAGGSTIVSVFASAMAGYALARLKFPGSNAVFFGLILSIALPQVALLVPMYEIFNTFGLNRTYHGLIILMSSLITPFTVWIMVSFVNQIPSEIEEAGYIDGANMFQVITRIVLPAMRPAIATMLIINFIISWNELLYPLVFASRNTKTLSVGLVSLGRASMGVSRPWDLMSALSVLMVIPVIILVIFGQRAIVSGLTRGAVK
ncbi:MAG: carbohydrate ABC transporter permease [Anaerolineae bacterium]|nr:carbohydrate ABC transporter permease [Anaerolineae bacterium]